MSIIWRQVEWPRIVEMECSLSSLLVDPPADMDNFPAMNRIDHDNFLGKVISRNSKGPKVIRCHSSAYSRPSQKCCISTASLSSRSKVATDLNIFLYPRVDYDYLSLLDPSSSEIWLLSANSEMLLPASSTTLVPVGGMVCYSSGATLEFAGTGDVVGGFSFGFSVAASGAAAADIDALRPLR